MKLKSSSKIFENYKADKPENTIRRIEDGFKKLNLELSYKQIMHKPSMVYSGTVQIVGTTLTSNGKGITQELSKASAYAELAERFSAGALFGFSTFSNLILKNNILFRDFIKDDTLIVNFNNYCYLNGYINTSYYEVENRIGFDAFLNKYDISEENLKQLTKKDFANHWVDAYSLTKKEYQKIPMKFIVKISGTNGLASGNTIEEAIVQGACELFERYCAINVIKNKKKIPTIDIKSIKDKNVLNLIDFFKEMGIDVVIKDFSMNNRFPVVGILFINKNFADETNQLKRDLYFKRIRVASSLNLNEALIRCFTEEMQGYSQEEFKHHEMLDILWNHWIHKMNKKYMKPCNSYKYLSRQYHFFDDISFLESESNSISFDKLKNINNSDFLYDVDKIIRTCINEHFDILVLDLTHPILNFPTVRVIIPTMSDIIDFIVNKFDIHLILDDEKLFDLLHFKNLYTFINDENWQSDNKKLAHLIENVEEYLSYFLFDDTLILNHFGLKNVYLFSLLAYANSAIKNYEEGVKYSELIIDLIIYLKKNRTLEANLNDFKENTNTKQEECTHQLSYYNPFINTCSCSYCRITYPKRLHKILNSFFNTTLSFIRKSA